MGARVLRHVRSNVVAYIALVMASTGTATAAGLIDGRLLVDRSVDAEKVTGRVQARTAANPLSCPEGFLRSVAPSGAPTCGTPSRDADTLDGRDSTDFLAADGKARDADLLDGMDATAFLLAEGKAADSDLLDGRNSTEFLAADGKAADADKLDGRNSTDFLAADGKAADSDKLDGKSSTEFLAARGTAADSDKLDGKDSAEFLDADGKARDADLLDGKDSASFGVVRAFTEVGRHELRVPDGVHQLVVDIIGGGGGGDLVTSFSGAGGGGGGSGAYRRVFLPVAPGQICTVDVGDSGAGGQVTASGFEIRYRPPNSGSPSRMSCPSGSAEAPGGAHGESAAGGAGGEPGGIDGSDGESVCRKPGHLGLPEPTHAPGGGAGFGAGGRGGCVFADGGAGIAGEVLVTMIS